METNNDYVLVTGGMGFIGSHVVVKLIELSRNVLIYDNLSNSDISVKDKINTITQRPELLTFVEGDIRDRHGVQDLFENYQIDTVMHFAALKSVNESESYPDLYQSVNVSGTQVILDVMSRYGCRNFIYSSSATVYGDSEPPVTEDSRVGNNLACNYARNKYDMEQYLISNYGDGKRFSDWNIMILRYFNPIGAHPSGLIGEDPGDIPNNVFPYLLRVARWTNTDSSDRDPESPYRIFTVFGNNYETRDGTCIRDYIHVQDLARAHVACLPLFESNAGLKIYNVGTGTGSTVMELVAALNRALIDKGKEPINYRIGDRRVGDLDVSYAIVDNIHQEIGFRTEFDVNKMCKDGLGFVGL